MPCLAMRQQANALSSAVISRMVGLRRRQDRQVWPSSIGDESGRGHVATSIAVRSEKSGVRSQLFEGLPDTIEVGRYHSWVVNEKNFPEELEITARDDNNYIMALQHRKYDVQGVQFHPESVLTPDGEIIIANWLKK